MCSPVAYVHSHCCTTTATIPFQNFLIFPNQDRPPVTHGLPIPCFCQPLRTTVLPPASRIHLFCVPHTSSIGHYLSFCLWLTSHGISFQGSNMISCARVPHLQRTKQNGTHFSGLLGRRNKVRCIMVHSVVTTWKCLQPLQSLSDHEVSKPVDKANRPRTAVWKEGKTH